MRVSADMPDDVRVLHDALEALRQYQSVQSAKSVNEKEPLILYLKNCGTALRFLEVHLAQCYPGEPITLTGDARLMERKGKPTTQTTSALILHGVNVPVEANESSYITMSRRIRESYIAHRLAYPQRPAKTPHSSQALWGPRIADLRG